MQSEAHMDVPDGVDSRQETLERYRHLRAINRDHHSLLMKHLPRKSFLTLGKRIGLIRERRVLVADNISEVHLLYDLAIYSARQNNMTAVERYRRRADFPEDSDEAIVLEAMCQSRFVFLTVERRHSSTGLIVRDLFRKEEIWLMDEGLEDTVPDGYVLASRLFKPDEFFMTTGVSIPLDEDAINDIATACPNMSDETMFDERKNHKFTEVVYRTAISNGAMDTMRCE